MITSKKILVVDDSSTNNLLCEEILSHAGYWVITAEDASSALRVLESESPDLILLDIMMPGIDGINLLQRLKATPQTSAIPVIMLTAKEDSPTIDKTLSMGAVEFLTKPINPGRLTSSIKKILV